MKDKALVSSLVVIVAAVAASQGVPVSDEEQQALVDGICGVVGGAAAVVAIVRAKVALFRSRGEE